MNLKACGRLALRPLNDYWYRAVKLRHWRTRLSTEHSRISRSRFSFATSEAPGPRVLYLGEHHQVGLHEVGALFGDPRDPLANPRYSWVVLSLRVVLDFVVDLSEETQLKLLRTSHQELTGLWQDRSVPSPTQRLGTALFERADLEGLLYPSARPPGRNLAIFPDKLGPRSLVLFSNEMHGRYERLH
jgi:RES domain-containing protein